MTDLSHSFEKTSSWRVAIRHPQSVDIDWSLPSLIKIDAEGAELMIIDALIPLLNKNSIICVEDHWAIMDVSEQKEYKKSLTSLISNLKSKGILFTKWM